MNSEKRENLSESFLNNKFVKNFLFLFSILLCFPNSFFSKNYLCLDNQPNKIELCLDQSWQTAINLALEKSFVFGKDFVFTYGPLGFLSTRVDIGIHPFYLLIFDLFIIANIAFIIWFVWKHYYNVSTILICLLLCYLSPLSDASFKMLMIMLFWLNIGFHKPSAKYFIVPFIISILSFFIKLNTSFLAIFIFYLFIIGSLIVHKKADLGKIVLAVLLPVGLFLSSCILNVDLAGYLKNGLELISSYNDSMNYISSSFTKYTIFVVLTSLLSLSGFTYLLFKNKKNLPTFISIFTFTLVLFVLFKQSLIRSDGLHLFAFFYFAPVLWLFCLLFLYDKSRLINVSVLFLSLITLLAGILPLRYDTKAAEFNPLNRFSYFSELISGKNTDAENRTFETYKLPDEIISMIGQKSVDIIPHNVNLIYFNHLNYNPRPVFQSYAAYSENLINLNRLKYESENAPDFVIFSNEILDNRYALFDDAGAKIALLENYAVSTSFNFNGNTYLLFERNPTEKQLRLGEPEFEMINFYQNYELKDLSKSYFIKIKIDYSLPGSILKIIYQPLSLKLIFNLDDGTSRELRAVNAILKGGVIVNPFVETDDDYEKFFKDETDQLKKIKSFHVEPLYNNNFEKLNLLNYTEPIKIETYEFSIN